MLISQARSKLFGSFQSLKLSSGHVVSNGNLQNNCQEAPVLHDSNIGSSSRQVQKSDTFMKFLYLRLETK